ncbi:hypothetical protein SDC9_09037 [bioreactor metagenome]|uniref:DUF4321 domain-containing protein n=1 Tax=bioreactor metagenome TaxID=1076179 RepID=A0A644T997_9ZZZZ
MRSKSSSYGMLALFMIIGAILGGILGELVSTSSLLSEMAPYLVRTFPIFDVPPITINLYVVKLTLGFAIYPNLISILGMIIAILLYRRF